MNVRLLLLFLLPGFCFGQSPAQKQKLVSLTQSLIDVYNSNDSVQYQNFIQPGRFDGARTASFLRQLTEEHAHLGNIKLYRIKVVSPTETEALVQTPQYEAWWRVVVITDSLQQFKEHHMGLVRVTDEVLQTGPLSDQQLKAAIDSFLLRQAPYQVFSGSVLVEQHGKTRYAGSFGNNAAGQPNSFTQQYSMASVSKLFTAVSILQLVDKKQLYLETEVATVLPRLKNKKLAHITIQQLLTHTSGMGDYFEDPGFEKIMDSTKNSLTAATGNTSSSTASFLPFIEKDSLQFEPGKGWRYSNTGFELLGMIVEKVTGVPFNRYVTEQVYKAAGMNNTVAGTGSGGSYATVTDLDLFARALKDARLLGKPMTEKLLAYTVNGQYGYGMEHQLLGGEHICGHSGGFEKVCNELNIYQHAGITVIILSNVDPPLGHFLSDKIKELLIRKEPAAANQAVND